MKTWEIHRELWVPRRREQVFPFFADAYNLQELTPDFLDFEIVTPRPIAMREGALIDYRLKVHGLPIKWRTEITAWEPDERFVDEQIRGPYVLWRHEHRFIEENGGTRCVDHVSYRPRGGALVNWLFVRRDVERIFDYREQRMGELFGGADGESAKPQAA